MVSFANVPSVHLDDHLVRLQRQFHLRFSLGRLLVQLGAQGLGAFALAAGLPVQGGARHLHSRQMFEDRAGLFHRHFAGQKGGRLLHRRRMTGPFLQS